MPCKRLRAREYISWTPVWGKEYEGYAANFYRSNKWRCDHVYEMRDLMQDAWIIFNRVKTSYPRVVDAANFMALYKRALANNMHDKAAYKRRKDAAEVHLSSDVSEFFTGRIGEVTNPGYLAALISEMPEEMQLVLNTLAKGLPKEDNQRKRWQLQPREGLSMQLRRLLRLPINSDPLAIIKRLLTP